MQSFKSKEYFRELFFFSSRRRHTRLVGEWSSDVCSSDLTRLIAEYGGIAKTVPLLTIAFVIVTLSSIGLPSTNGFVGEFLILTGTFISQLPHGRLLAVIGASGVILGAVYMLTLVEKVFYGTIENEENRHLSDLSVREGFVLATVIVLIFVMGIVPGPFLAPAKSSVDRLVGRFQAAEARLNIPSTVGTVASAISLPRVPLAPPPAEGQ